MNIEFYKYQGTGNDFVLIDNRTAQIELSQAQIARLCDRKFGIGADGLMLLENSKDHDFTMVYYNADGKTSSMCGNGGRCIAHFANYLDALSGKNSFEAIDGIHPFEIKTNDIVKLKMNDVLETEQLKDAHVLDTGSPHYVAVLEDIDKLDIIKKAHKVRYNDRFHSEGINVNFVEFVDDKIFMRTYERGVEDETLSCGTGTVAVALTSNILDKKWESPLEINTPGGKLKVYFTEINARFSDIWLEGPAKLVFKGSIDV